ncbi:LacI family DNA-binding transcriptional regulator [Microbacterium sp. F51-2R]|uniref:LacI family DNA-binding transcriptional regulator n=1 Tax=Microbacterium sp. F51-2R TaxID=3445777 RepID=UPI003F9F44DC
MSESSRTEWGVEPRRVTSADVAKALGVSRATVSYVLNNRLDKPISEDTRRRVLAKAAELGHVPDAAARALRKGRSTIVLGLVPGFTIGTIFDEMLEHMSRHIAERGYALLLHRMPPAPDAAAALQELSQHLHPAVVAVLGGAFDTSTMGQLAGAVHAKVVTDADIIDHTDIGRMQGAFLLEHGHDRIAFASSASPLLRPIAGQRLRGVQRACDAAGVAAPLADDVTDALSETTAAVARWREAGMTGVCCYNDDIAIRVMFAMRELGMTEGRELALIGVDNSPLSQLGITTLAADPEEVGHRVAQRVLRALGETTDAPSEDPVMSVVRRRSA